MPVEWGDKDVGRGGIRNSKARPIIPQDNALDEETTQRLGCAFEIVPGPIFPVFFDHQPASLIFRSQ